MEEITYEQYKDACLVVKNYRIQEQKKRIAKELVNLKTNPKTDPNIEDFRESYGYRLYYQILIYFGKSPGYHRLEGNLKISDLKNASKAKFFTQKDFGRRLWWQLEDLCKKYDVVLGK